MLMSVINFIIAAPAYLKLLPEGTMPIIDLEEFLERLALRMGMIKRGQELDLERAAVYFVRWWREEGGLIAASSASPMGTLAGADSRYPGMHGWGFDFQWQSELDKMPLSGDGAAGGAKFVQDKMEACIDEYLVQAETEDAEENNLSDTQIKKQEVLQEKLKRKQRYLKKLKK